MDAHQVLPFTNYLNSGANAGAAIRALDARSAGGSYRVIAEALFGKSRSPTVPGRPMICAIEQSAWCKAALR
jgi:hypothetical protein